jgi:hypothetical protein
MSITKEGKNWRMTITGNLRTEVELRKKVEELKQKINDNPNDEISRWICNSCINTLKWVLKEQEDL